MGPKLNAETEARGHLTIIDFITSDVTVQWRRKIGVVCALMILFCFVFYISSQFQAAGNALTEVFGLNATEAILLGALIIVIYCLMGGFVAASLTDAIQASVMMVACVLVPIAAIQATGGMGVVIETLHQTQPKSYFRFTGDALGLAGIGGNPNCSIVLCL